MGSRAGRHREREKVKTVACPLPLFSYLERISEDTLSFLEFRSREGKTRILVLAHVLELQKGNEC